MRNFSHRFNPSVCPKPSEPQTFSTTPFYHLPHYRLTLISIIPSGPDQLREPQTLSVTLFYHLPHYSLTLVCTIPSGPDQLRLPVRNSADGAERAGVSLTLISTIPSGPDQLRLPVRHPADGAQRAGVRHPLRDRRRSGEYCLNAAETLPEYYRNTAETLSENTRTLPERCLRTTRAGRTECHAECLLDELLQQALQFIGVSICLLLLLFDPKK